MHFRFVPNQWGQMKYFYLPVFCTCVQNSLAVCSRCGERITDRVLKAVGQCFHAHCFRCTACSCTLEGSPFITDDNNNPFCVTDYHRWASTHMLTEQDSFSSSVDLMRISVMQENMKYIKWKMRSVFLWPLLCCWITDVSLLCAWAAMSQLFLTLEVRKPSE